MSFLSPRTPAKKFSRRDVLKGLASAPLLLPTPLLGDHSGSSGKDGPATRPGKKRVILFGIDSMPPEQLLFFSERGTIPNITRLLEKGCLASAQTSTPTDCPTNWTTINTGAWSGTTGINGFYRHEPGESFDVTRHSTWGSTGFVKQEFLWEALGRAGKKSILVDWPVIAWDRRSPPNAVVIGDAGDGHWVMLGPTLYSTSREHLQPAKEWKNLPPSELPPLEWQAPRTDSIIDFPTAGRVSALHWREFIQEELKNANKLALPYNGGPVWSDDLISRNDPEPTYYFLIYSSGGAGYNSVLLTKGKDGARPLAVLKPGEGPTAVHDRFLLESGVWREGGFYVQIRTLDPRAEFVEIFRTDIESDSGWSSPPGLDEEIAHTIGPFPNQTSALRWAPNFGTEPYSALLPWDGLNARWLAKTAVHLARKNPDWDLLAVYNSTIDMLNHRFMGDFLRHTYPGWSEDKHRFALETMESEFRIMDGMVGEIVSELADNETTVVLVSDHGHIPKVRYFDLPLLLWKAGLMSYKWQAPMGNEDGYFDVDWSKTKCVPFYFADNIFINRRERDPEGIVSDEDYAKVRDEIIRVLESLVDPATGKSVIQMAIKKPDAFALGHFADDPYAGDILYFPAAGYAAQRLDSTRLYYHQWKKSEPPTIDPNSLYYWLEDGGGQHDTLPGTIFRDSAGNEVSTYSAVLMSGQGIRRHFRPPHPVRLVDVAPTIAFLLNAPPLHNAEGSVLLEFLERVLEQNSSEG